MIDSQEDRIFFQYQVGRLEHWLKCGFTPLPELRILFEFFLPQSRDEILDIFDGIINQIPHPNIVPGRMLTVEEFRRFLPPSAATNQEQPIDLTFIYFNFFRLYQVQKFLQDEPDTVQYCIQDYFRKKPGMIHYGERKALAELKHLWQFGSARDLPFRLNGSMAIEYFSFEEFRDRWTRDAEFRDYWMAIIEEIYQESLKPGGKG